MSKNKKKNKIPKPRNWLAIHAFQRSGSGNHGDKKKQRSKKLCRQKIKQSERH